MSETENLQGALETKSNGDSFPFVNSNTRDGNGRAQSEENPSANIGNYLNNDDGQRRKETENFQSAPEPKMNGSENSSPIVDSNTPEGDERAQSGANTSGDLGNYLNNDDGHRRKETENLPSASEPKTNGDNISAPIVDSNTLGGDERAQSEANTSGDIDMLDADWVVQDEVHSDDDSEETSHDDSTEQQDNVENVSNVKQVIAVKGIAEQPSEIKDESIEGMDIDLDNNVSDTSITVREEEEDALLEDETEPEETTSEALVPITVEEPSQSEVTDTDFLNVEGKKLFASNTRSDEAEHVTSSSIVEEKTKEKTSPGSAEDEKTNISDVISLNEETMSETEKSDSTLIEDTKKCINIDDDDDDIMLVDDQVEKTKVIAKIQEGEDSKDTNKVDDEQKVKHNQNNVSKADEKVEIDKADIVDEDVKPANVENIDGAVGVYDVTKIHDFDNKIDKKVKTQDHATTDNVKINYEAKIVDKAEIVDDEDENYVEKIDKQGAKVEDKIEMELDMVKSGNGNDEIDDISELDDLKVMKKNNFQNDREICDLHKLKRNETAQIADAEIPSKEDKIDKVFEISEAEKVEDKVKMAKAENELECDGTSKVSTESEDKDSTDPDVIIKSRVDDQPCKTVETPNDYDVPLNNMVEGLDEKTIIFVDDVVKAGFKKILISDKSLENKPLTPSNFIKSFSKKLTDMTRDDLEEFCLLKIVEGIVERSTLSEATTKLKSLMQHVDEWRKKAQQLQKQNRDLSVVLRNIQEEHRKRALGVVTPLKITRSVGLQVSSPTNNNNQNNQNIPNVPLAEQRAHKQKKVQGKANTNRNQKQNKAPVKTIKKIAAPKPSTPNVPVPRLVPVLNSPPKVSQQKNVSAASNGSHTTKAAEKRPLSEVNNSIDLTDDEPPSKQIAVTSPSNLMRLVNPGQGGAGAGGQRMAFMVNSPLGFNSASPRQVYIPIAGQGTQGTIRPGQTLMFAGTGPRSKAASQINPPPLIRNKGELHESTLPPLPGSYRQMHLPNWKWIPPSPELKISRVDTESTSIVISWMLKDFDENKHEKVVSYQIYAYHEAGTRVTSTASWIKIGDVKALPLPMACTLSQFKMQNKYHFVVRGVDAKSRVGPFSPPGSIVLVKHPTNAINGINK